MTFTPVNKGKINFFIRRPGPQHFSGITMDQPDLLIHSKSFNIFLGFQGHSFLIFNGPKSSFRTNLAEATGRIAYCRTNFHDVFWLSDSKQLQKQGFRILQDNGYLSFLCLVA